MWGHPRADLETALQPEKPLKALLRREIARFLFKSRHVQVFIMAPLPRKSPAEKKKLDLKIRILLREFLKALETTTAMKRRKISGSGGSDC